jgi:hypothetical protein
VADEERSEETNPQAAKLQRGGKHPLPARGTIVGTNVSWEEQRKGMEPQTPQDLDATFYDERFTSERQRVDRASTGWDVLEPEGAAEAPNWPPPLRP